MDQLSTTKRLYSLDALRGFDMFWIMGAEAIFHRMADATGTPFWESLSHQFDHPAWNGFTAYDLIFPLFLFLAGVATPYSIGRELEKGKSRKELLVRVIKRGFLLVLLGVLYNNGLEIRPLAELRVASVLGRIGLAYMFANIIYLYTREMGQMIWFFGLLIGYWLLLMFTSAPGYPMGDLSMEGNFASYLDTFLVPGRLLYPGVHDPEGLVSALPAIATGLLGIWAGNLLRHSPVTDLQKVMRMVLTGIGFLVVAQIWNLVFPINKNLWSSSFVLQCGGFSLLLLSLFYYVIDIRGYQKGFFFFKVIGMNSILIYLSGGFINWTYSAQAFFGWMGQLAGEPFGAVIMVFAYLAVQWAFLYFMYRKNVFLRV